MVAWGIACIGSAVLEEHVSSSDLEGLVGIFHEHREGMFVLGAGAACKTRGKRMRPSCRGKVRRARASIGRCFLSGGEGTFVRQSKGT